MKSSVIPVTSVTFKCARCSREWYKLDGDRVSPPEACPFCTLADEMDKDKLSRGHLKRLEERVDTLEGWLRIYMLLRKTHKSHRRALLVVNKTLRAGIASMAWMLGSHPNLINTVYQKALDLVLLDRAGVNSQYWERETGDNDEA